MAAIESWAVANGVTISEWHQDHGVSGSTPIEARSGLMAALSAVNRLRAAHLVVARRDRLARDRTIAPIVEARWLRPLGARLRSVAGEGTDSSPDDPDAVLTGGLHDLLAEHVRAVIRQRTKAALDVKRRRGERIGAVPFGSSVAPDGVTLVCNNQEAAIVERICSLSESGLSQRSIARVLASEGVVSPRSGRPLSQVQICRVLARASRLAA